MPTGTVDLDRRANWRDFASTINGQTATQVRSLDETAGGGGRANEYERIDMTRGSQHSIQQLTYDEAGNLVATDLLGDMNCDGAVNSFDVDPFTQALTNPAAYAAAHPDCMIELGDVNGDGLVNLFDVNAFIDLLGDNLMSARRYEYDEENRLTAVTDVCGRELLTIEYDALGRRIASTEYAIPMDACPGESGPIVAQTRHIYSGLNTMAEYVWSDSQWSKAREFLWGERFPEPLVLIDFTDAGELEAGTPEVLHYVHDALGSVVGLVDAGDPAATPDPIPPKLVERYDYDPYGKTYIETWDAEAGGGAGAWESATASAYGNPFAWTGQRYDAGLGMYHFLFRSYSPELGRWMQRDPLGYVDGVNPYQYARTAPTCFADPLGLIVKWEEGENGSPERTARAQQNWEAAKSRTDRNGQPTAGGQAMADLEKRQDVTVTIRVGDKGTNVTYDGQDRMPGPDNPNKTKVQNGERMDTTINYNPDGATKTYEDGVRSDPEATLVHEAWHAHDYAEGNYKRPENRKRGDIHPKDANEVRAAQVENENRESRGLEPRKKIVDREVPKGLPEDAKKLKPGKCGSASSQP